MFCPAPAALILVKKKLSFEHHNEMILFKKKEAGNVKFLSTVQVGEIQQNYTCQFKDLLC